MILRWWRQFGAALQFLTVLPLVQRIKSEPQDLAACTIWFPVVGLLIGIAALLLDLALSAILPSTLVVIGSLLFLAAISGGLHLDGFCDTADGFFSSRPKDAILKIMKDPCSGPMAIIAVVFLLLIKMHLLLSLAPELRRVVLLLTPLAGRVAVLVMMRSLNYVRDKAGIAAVFNQGGLGEVLWGLGLFTLIAFMFLGINFFWPLLTLLSVAALFTLYCRRKIDGYTGDTLGALCEIAELTPALAILLQLGMTK